ncbi:MAG: hypothetical protein CMF96_01055 [Candidatus Marinimicrobia bacterium]|nr:hypothetical protein [Candidatus Neomarinimicrobiota bacterium]|tara:strand:- start:8231 stop:8611 length:381 start_codon:yes stop_codon:yes gene_type:complete
MELNINSINSQIGNNSKVQENSSIENQKEITKLDNIDYSKNKVNKNEDLSEIIKKEDYNSTIDSVNQYVEMFNSKVSFSIDDKSREIIHVYDNETGDLIRQIPPKEMIELVDKLEEIAGIIFNNKV